MKVLHVQALEWGNGENPFSLLRLFVCDDPRYIDFGGDAYWQWAETPLRAKGSRLCWSQLLHDSMEGWHASVLHAGAEVSIMPHHPDFSRIDKLVELSDGTDEAAIRYLFE